MKLYKLKDTVAIFWFLILVFLQYNKYYNTVLVLLALGALGDFLVSVTNIGEKEINI